MTGTFMRVLIFILFLVLAGGCSTVRTDTGTSTISSAEETSIGLRDDAPVTRQEVLRAAEAYANHPWQAGEANIFHGNDAAGARVDTPDREWCGRGGWLADGRINKGLPYCWGGDSTLTEFDEGIAAGRPAGYHFKRIDRRKKKDPPDSALPVGVDCSGFVSRCWRLKTRRSTYDLAEVCEPLSSFDDLQPGDVVNKPYNHVILFAGWVDANHSRMRVFEAGDAKRHNRAENYERVHEDSYDRKWLEKKGFAALKYRGMVENGVTQLSK